MLSRSWFATWARERNQSRSMRAERKYAQGAYGSSGNGALKTSSATRAPSVRPSPTKHPRRGAAT